MSLYRVTGEFDLHAATAILDHVMVTASQGPAHTAIALFAACQDPATALWRLWHSS